MVPSVDGTSAYTADTYGTSYSATLAGGTGSNRLLVVRMVFNGNDDTTATKVTWNNVDLTNLYTVGVSSTYSPSYYQVWYLTNTASGSNTLAASFGTATNVTLSAVWYTGVNQTDPLGAHNDNANQNAPSSYTSTLTTTAPNSLVSDFLVAGSCGGTSGITPGGGQSLEYAKVACSSGDNDIYGDNIKAVSQGSYSLTYTLSPTNGADWNGHTLEIMGVGCFAGTTTPTQSPTVTTTPSGSAVPTCPPAPAVGANTPFVTYEGEAGTLGGGATVVTLTTPTTELSSPALEASGHAYVQLTGLGQSVSWTNNTCFSVSAVNIRACIPDSAGGGGITSTLDLYVDGTFRQAVTLSSTQTWVYESTSSYNGMSQAPGAGLSPHVFWDEARTFITGAPVASGSTIMLKVDAANTASFYYVDCIDLENPPAPLTQPSGSLSIAAAPYNAVANNSGVDNTTAIQNCLNAAQSAGEAVWIPSGTYYCSSGAALSAQDVTVEGAGPWYSTVVDSSSSWSNGFFFLAHGASFQNLCIDATQPDATPGLFAILAYGSTNNPGWTINNVWARHTMLTWGTGVGVTVENSRVNNSWGDGININNTNGTACSNVTVTNNFSRGNGDDGIALNSSNASAPLMTNCTFTHNTCVASWWANEMGIYGGSGVVVENNLLEDSVKLNGMLVGIFGNGGTGGSMTQALVMNNTILRGGSLGYGNQNPGIAIGGAQGGSAPSACANIVVSENTVTDAMFNGINFYNGLSQTAQYNTITSPGLNGIGEGSDGTTNTYIDNTVTGLTTGQAVVNNDGSNVLVQGTPAASYSGENSVVPETCAEGGQDVGTIVNGSYTYYSGITMNGLSSFNARVASAGSGGNIEVRLDSPTGTLIGTCAVPVTGGWQTWTTETCAITATTGSHTIYLVYTGGGGNLFNIEWFSFP